ncbi:ABC transporter ATP-binding protein [bacterium]|jgi:capsular polysaccharide transport system ATP-binding protein|nr:ABC transporter ATP-binding protein [bacterium]
MIKLNNVSKIYKTNGKDKYILNNVSLEIPTGKNIAILGANGAGKSTLLRMLGQIDFPTSGTIESDLTFSWPMGLAGGFQGSMTGRNNVKFVCRIYGKSNKNIKEGVEFVKNFSELGDYFEMPIKTYSSGMKSRLSFALSLFFDFNYLIIDETLSVGDKAFQEKSKKALRDKIKNSNAILVSHQMSTLKEICDVSIYLEDGKLFYFDNVEEGIQHYLNKK